MTQILSIVMSGDQIPRDQDTMTVRLTSAKNDNNWWHLDTIIILQLTLIISHLSGSVCTISHPAPGLGSRVSSLVFPRLHHYPTRVISKTRESSKPF